jgi:hypothetical protein
VIRDFTSNVTGNDHALELRECHDAIADSYRPNNVLVREPDPHSDMVEALDNGLVAVSINLGNPLEISV